MNRPNKESKLKFVELCKQDPDSIYEWYNSRPGENKWVKCLSLPKWDNNYEYAHKSEIVLNDTFLGIPYNRYPAVQPNKISVRVQSGDIDTSFIVYVDEGDAIKLYNTLKHEFKILE